MPRSHRPSEVNSAYPRGPESSSASTQRIGGSVSESGSWVSRSHHGSVRAYSPGRSAIASS